MSSILKALQKLETHSTQQAKGRLLTGSATIPSDRRWRVLSIVLLLFLFFTVGRLFLINRPTDGLNSISVIDANNPGIRAMGPSDRSDLMEKKIPKITPPKQTDSVQANLKPKKYGRLYPPDETIQANRVQAVRPSLLAKPDDKAGQIMSVDTGKPLTQDKEKDKAASRTARKTATGQADKIITTPYIQAVDPSILKLQAISWSPDAKDRMTVINNRILREKSSIEGYVIILIDQDSVIVRRGTEKGRLIF